MFEGAPLSVPPQESVPQRERLSDEQMGSLLAAVGNHEAKAILLILMEPHTAYSARELYQLAMNGQGQGPGWRMDHSLPFKYCERTLAPIGLVAQEILTEGDLQTIAYIKTDYGEEVGSPLAGLLLDYSINHPDVSLLQLFASTKSSSKSGDSQAKKRAPMTRLKIFRELVRASLPIRMLDLLTATREDPAVVENHLWQLNKMGVVDYKSIKQGEPVTFYKLSPDHPSKEPPQYSHRPGLTKFIYKALIDNPDKEWTLEELIQLYLQSRNKNRNEINYKRQYTMIDEVCSHLERNRYIQHGEFSKDKQTNINLSSQQKQKLIDLITLIGGFQRQDPETLAKGRDMVPYFKDHPEEVAKLMAKAREKSPNANQQPMEETTDLINGILISQPGLTIKELQGVLIQYGRNLSTRSIDEITSKFHIPFSMEKGVKHFFPTQIHQRVQLPKGKKLPPRA